MMPQKIYEVQQKIQLQAGDDAEEVIELRVL
jgi:hypothetical protein